MDALRVVAELDGFFTRAQARDLGYDDKAVAAAVRARVWIRFRRGYFAFADAWSALDEEARHRVRAHAVLHSLGPHVALCSVSAALEHEIAVVDVDLTRVHVTRLDGGAGRVEGDVVHHEGVCFENDVREINGRLLVSPERSVLETASRLRGAAKLVPLDSLLHLGKGTEQTLADQFTLMQRWPFMQSLHVPVRMADGRAASPGESIGRHFFWTAGLPAPQLQFEVHDASGRLVGTCDWGWPGLGVLGEFDGRVKYGRLLKPGQQPGDVVFAEKQREDELRDATGYRMVRVVWSDFERPRLLRERLEKRLRRTA